MKYFFFLTVFLFAALFSECKKEQAVINTPIKIDTIVQVDTLQQPLELGEGSVIKNGVNWPEKFYGSYGNKGKKSFQIRIGFVA